MKNNVNYEKLAIGIFLGLAALSSLLICAFCEVPLPTQIGLLVVVLTALALISPKSNVFKGAGSNAYGTFDILIGSEYNFNKSKPVSVERIGSDQRTVVSVDPIESEDLTDEVRAVRDNVHNIMRTGFNAENSVIGLRFLNRHEPVVKDSWLLLLNRASLQGMTGQLSAAEATTRDVLARFSENAKAAGWAYGILSWLEEFRQPPELSGLYKEWLERRTSFALKALEADPGRHLSQWNAFEVAVLNKDRRALRYLENAILINKEFTEAKVVALSLENEAFIKNARKLSYGLSRKLNKLLKGEKNMRVLRTVKTSFLPLSLAIFAVPALFLGYQQVSKVPQDLKLVSAVAATTVKSSVQLSEAWKCVDGNDLGKFTMVMARAGNDLGK
jgi:hypothetical protein